MDRGFQDRIEDWLPADLTSRAEIERAMKDYGWFEGPDGDEWSSEKSMDTVVDWATKQRDPDVTEIQREASRQTTVMGPQTERQPAIRAEDGTTIGSPRNVKTWEDRWGNIMGQNTETGARKKIRDAEDR